MVLREWINTSSGLDFHLVPGLDFHLGKAEMLGSLEIGKQGDVVVLDLERPASFGPCSSVYDRIVYGAGRDAVRHVAVAGTPLLRDGALVSIDEARTLARAGEEVRALVDRAL